ncbi:MAG: galactoside O-acetyltransferase [Muribaculaceae bacterium]|uniref:acyltransferase n=1 Tax=uncultured Bacteroides sp. TaxID=162156 RepID=UPI003220A0A9
MEEIRIDCSKQTPEQIKDALILKQNLFRLNHTMPGTAEYNVLAKKVFPNLLDDCRIETPVMGVRMQNVHFGHKVIIMPGCLFMSAGGITIDDGAMIAANTQLISNNHDLNNRSVITCKPIYIGKNVWIGAGSTILPGVTVGDNAVVGAGSVVTKDVPPSTIVTGNPAKIIRKIEP